MSARRESRFPPQAVRHGRNTPTPGTHTSQGIPVGRPLLVAWATPPLPLGGLFCLLPSHRHPHHHHDHGSHSRTSLPPSVHSRETTHPHLWPRQCPLRGPLAPQSRTNLGWRDHRRGQCASLLPPRNRTLPPPPSPPPAQRPRQSPGSPPRRTDLLSVQEGRGQAAGPGGHTRARSQAGTCPRSQGRCPKRPRLLVWNLRTRCLGRACVPPRAVCHPRVPSGPPCLPSHSKGRGGQRRNALPIAAAQLSPVQSGPPGSAAARHPGPGLGRRPVQALWGPSGCLPPWRTR